jgi:uncharacterized protein (TIGR02611 family)
MPAVTPTAVGAGIAPPTIDGPPLDDAAADGPSVTAPEPDDDAEARFLDRFDWYRSFRARLHENRLLERTWVFVVFSLGVTVICVGLAGLVFPVLPGWALIFIGLGILSSEFMWALRVLRAAKRFLRDARVRTADPVVRRRLLLVGGLTLALAVAGGAAWVSQRGWPAGLPFVG